MSKWRQPAPFHRYAAAREARSSNREVWLVSLRPQWKLCIKAGIFKEKSKSIYYSFYCFKCHLGVKCPEIQIICYNYLEFCCITRETGRLHSRDTKNCDVSVELREKYQTHLLVLIIITRPEKLLNCFLCITDVNKQYLCFCHTGKEVEKLPPKCSLKLSARNTEH